MMVETGVLFDKDIRSVSTLLADWPEHAWQPLCQALMASDEHPVLLVGEGSSRLFPASFALHLRRAWNAPIHIDHLGGREASGVINEHQCIVGLSNSGDTREVVELLDQLREQNHERVLCITGRDDGYMTKGFEHYALLAEPEGAVAATVSVFGQAFILADAIAAIAGKTVPKKEIKAEIERILNADLPDAVLAQLAATQRIFWSGAEGGCASELTLKTLETCRVLGTYAPGSLILHGIEEVFDEGDLVVLVDPAAQDKEPYNNFIVNNTPAKTVQIGGPDYGVPRIEHADLGVWNPLLQLVIGWKLLVAQANALGNDPDKPQRARKVGNPRVP